MPMPPGLRRALHKKLSQDFMDYYRDLDPEEQAMIESHLQRGRAGIDEGDFDEWVSSGGVSERQTFARPADVIERLETIIAGGPRAPEDLTVYRGGPDPVSTRMRRWRYPVSTSLDPDVAKWFADDYFEEGRVDELLVPEGSPMLYPAQLYELMDQYEVLLPAARATRTERLAPTRAKLARMFEEARTPEEMAEFESLEELMDRYQYEPPYRAEGGLVHGYA